MFISLLFAFFFAASANAAYVASPVNVVNSGASGTTTAHSMSLTLDQIAKRRTLIFAHSVITGDGYFFSASSLQQTATGYYTPTGTLYCNGFWYNSAATSRQVKFGYADVGVQDSGSAPAGAVYFAPSSGGTDGYIKGGGNINENAWHPMSLKFPSGKVPFVQVKIGATNAFWIQLDCIEI